MKKIAIALGLVISLLVPVQAQAAQASIVANLSDIAASGATVPLLLSNAIAGTGYYIQECAEPASGVRPTICNDAAQLWISNSPGASFPLSAVILFKPSANFISKTTTVDCFVSKCGIFLRYDHTKPTDTSEDKFLPLLFKVSAAAPALPSDLISATLNGLAMSTSTPIKLAYRAPATLAATSASGAVLSYVSLAPECALDGMKITALKGTGLCNISISSPGSVTSGAITKQYPIELTPGVQVIPEIKIGTKLATVTNFGEKVIYKAFGSCLIKKNVAIAKKGMCTIEASAQGRSNLFLPLMQSKWFRVK
jgi:hypothetical protein